jgi:hypothetical protein
MDAGDTVDFASVVGLVSIPVGGELGGCGGDPSIEGGSYSISWSSDTESVATISGSSSQSTVSVHGVGGGQSLILATLTDSNFGCSASDGAIATVKPKVNSVSPAIGLVGTSVSVTIAGVGFGASPTVAVSGNITVSNIQVNAQRTQITATFGIPANAQSGGNQTVTVTSQGQSSNNDKTFHVQVPTKLVRLSVPGASGGIGPLVQITDGNVVDLNGAIRLTHECGVYRNFAFDIEESNGTSINGTYVFTENFSNYSTTAGLTVPPSQSQNLSGDGTVTDLQFFGTPAPTCPGSNEHESFDMSFKVTVGGTDFNLSTVQHIDRGNFSGTAKVDASITTP